MSEFAIIKMIYAFLGFVFVWLVCDKQHSNRDKRIEQGINDLQNHRDEIIGKEVNEA